MKFIEWLNRWRQRSNPTMFAQENLLEDVLRWVLLSIDPRLFRSNAQVPVRTVLNALSPTFLVDIDQRMRSHRRRRDDDLPNDLLDRLARPDIDDATREAGQFLLSMHWSGYLREQALRELERRGSRLALAAALIRSADWVDSVRELATDVAERLIDSCSDDDVFAVMPLVFRLQSHTRFDHARVHGKFETWLRSRDRRLVRGLREGYPPMRRWSFELLLARSATIDPSLLELAINDTDPTIAMVAFRLLDDLPEGTCQSLIAIGLEAKHPLIRQFALRSMARVSPAVPIDILHRALFDRSAGMRSFAAHTLRVQYNADPADIWRARIDVGVAPPAAALSLAELASPDDEARLRRLLAHTDARTRAAALRSLVKMGMAVTDDAFLQIAADPSRRVSGVLATLCRKGDIRLDPHRLRLIWTSLPERAAEVLTALLDALPAGEREGLLLTFEPATEAARMWWNGMLAAWSAQALGWWEPSTQLHRRLEDLLTRQAAALEAQLRQRFEQAVSPRA
ncbi:hypothetical protein ACVWWJ_002523 [Luteibacter sp. HA06]